MEFASIVRINLQLVLGISVLNFAGDVVGQAGNLIGGISRLILSLCPVVHIGSQTSGKLQLAELRRTVTGLEQDGRFFSHSPGGGRHNDNRKLTCQQHRVFFNPVSISIILQGNAGIKSSSSHINHPSSLL